MIEIIKKQFIIALSLLFISVYLITFLNTNNYIFSLITFIFFIIFPGYLILINIKQLNYNIWNILPFSVAFSILFHYVLGLIVNFVGPLFGLTEPLSKIPLLIIYALIMYLMLLLYLFRDIKLDIKLNIKYNFFFKYIYFIFPPFFVFLSVFGSILLNNSNNNFFILALLICISVNIFISLLYKNRINEHYVVWSIYFSSLAMLLMVSLRSSYVTGWDIQHEYEVFNYTNNLGKWAPNYFPDAYNACLSITLFPTIISKLTSIPQDYIYKVLYQIIFSFTPIVIYLTFRRYTSIFISYLSIVYIMAQPLFIQPMTALTRQEIAFIFFTLLIYILLNENITKKIRNILFLVFGIGMILSHYSTTYVALILLLITYSLRLMNTALEYLLTHIKFINKFNGFQSKYIYLLNPGAILILLSLTIFWYGLVNNQLGPIRDVISKSFTQMDSLFKRESVTSESKMASSFLSTDQTTSEDINKYVDKKFYISQLDTERLYPKAIYEIDNVFPIRQTQTPPLLDVNVTSKFFIFFEILKQIFKIAVIVGPLFLFIKYFYKKKIPREYIILCIISVIEIVVLMYIPTLSLQYNLSRLYLQLLFYLSLGAILLINFILIPIKKINNTILLTSIVLLFLYLTGVFNQIIGGEAKFYLHNYGADYDKFYVHKSELASSEWVKAHIGSNSLMYMDREAHIKMNRIFNRGFNPDVLPALIYKDAYVYSSYMNHITGHMYVNNGGVDLFMNFPTNFLNNNKDVIYSNGESVIYK